MLFFSLTARTYATSTTAKQIEKIKNFILTRCVDDHKLKNKK